MVPYIDYKSNIEKEEDTICYILCKNLTNCKDFFFK